MTRVAAGLARLIRLSTVVDRGFRLFDRVRSRAVLAVASDAVLDAYNDTAYGATAEYQTDSPSFRHDLFRWEEEALGAFPAPPGRVLVGGAGGGREAFALAIRGYAVVAFEPAPRLAAGMAAAAARERLDVRVLRGRYDALPALTALDGTALRLPDLGPFDAGVLGWSSFSHIRRESARVATLRAFGDACHGPMLVSFFPAEPGQARDVFSAGIGYYRQSDEAEIRRLAAAAGLTVTTLSLDHRDGRWPYALLRAGASSAG